MSDFWSLYLIRCNDNSLYTGISNNVEKRFEVHQKGDRSTKYTRSRRPLKLVFQVPVGSKSLASKMEIRVKKMSKKHKEMMIRGLLSLEELQSR